MASISKKIDNFKKDIEKEIGSFFSGYVETASAKISEKFDLELEDVKKILEEVKEASDVPVNKVTPKRKKPVAKKTVGGVVQTCVAVLQKKGEVCGKKATTEIDGKSYCGIHAKSAGKKEEPGKKKKTIPTKKGTLKENEKKSKERVTVLAKKVIKPESIKLITIGDRKMHEKTRILFNSGKAYGKLDEDDNEKILPLEDNDIVFLERHGIEQCNIPLKTDTDDEEEEEEKSKEASGEEEASEEDEKPASEADSEEGEFVDLEL